jgi:hypothetical protein
MQYTSKIALLAVALFGTSALAAPYAGEAGFDVEAREVDNDISARELFEMYLEARADPSLDARDLESLDFEAREYLEYLEAREATTVPPPQTPLSHEPSHVETTSQSPHGETTPHSHVETSEHSHGDHVASHSESKKTLYLTPHQKAVHRAKKLAAKEFEDPKAYQAALADKEDKFHRFAVQKYLSKPKHLKKALADSDSPYHKAAKRILHHRKAKVYLSDKSNYKKALKHKHHKYHKDAVKKYFSHGENFEKALFHKDARFHKAAVREYLLDTKTRKSVLSDPTNPFYKQAKKLQKKINKRHNHIKVADGSLSGNSTSTPDHKA